MRQLILLLLALTLVAPRLAWAESGCHDDESIGKCRRRLETEAKQAEADENQKNREAVKASVSGKATGVDIFGDKANSATKDLLSGLSAAVKSLAQDDKQQELTITSNLPWCPLDSKAEGGRPAQRSWCLIVQLQGVAHQPQLYSPLKQQLSGAGEVTKEESRLHEWNDLSGVVSFSLSNATIGRYFSRHEDEFDVLHRAVLHENQPRNSLLDQLDNQVNVEFAKPGSEEQLASAAPAALRTNVEAYGLLYKAFLVQRSKSQYRTLALFSDMVANQPQAVLTGAYRSKSILTGPDEPSAQGTFEYSYYNLNRYRSRARKCAESTDGDACRLQVFQEYADKYSKSSLSGLRFSGSVQETWIHHYAFALPADAVSLNVPRARRTTWSATAGMQFAPADRADLSAQYDNYTDDPMQKDRLTVTLTYTRRFTDTFSLPLGVVYANHGEFVGEVQRRFGVHFGLTWKLFGQNGG